MGQNDLSSDEEHTVVVNNPFDSPISIDAFMYEPIFCLRRRHLSQSPLASSNPGLRLRTSYREGRRSGETPTQEGEEIAQVYLQCLLSPPS